jgi:hypothetical protein
MVTCLASFQENVVLGKVIHYLLTYLLHAWNTFLGCFTWLHNKLVFVSTLNVAPFEVVTLPLQMMFFSYVMGIYP